MLDNATASFERTLQRADISHHLKRGETVQRVINATRLKTDQRAQLQKSMAQEICMPDHQAVEILQYVYDQLDDKTQVFAIGLLASAAHGGSMIRRHIGTEPFHDLDTFSIVGTSSVDLDKQLTVLQEKIEVLKKAGDPLIKGLPADFNLCNGASFATKKVLDIRPIKMDDLQTIFQTKLPIEFAYFFLPTCPPQVGTECREKLLAGLQSLYAKDQPRWVKVTQALKQYWADEHALKYKYLSADPATAQKITKHLSMKELMEISRNSTQAFNTIIDGTGKGD